MHVSRPSNLAFSAFGLSKDHLEVITVGGSSGHTGSHGNTHVFDTGKPQKCIVCGRDRH